MYITSSLASTYMYSLVQGWPLDEGTCTCTCDMAVLEKGSDIIILLILLITHSF